MTTHRELAGVRGGLRQLSLFSILDTETREALIKRCHRLLFEPGQTVFMQGSKHEHSYIIESGLIRTYYASESGREITLGHWSDGDLVGGPSVFGSGYHVWSGTAAQRSRVLAISGPALHEFASCNAEVYPWIVDVLCFKLHWLSILFQVHGTPLWGDNGVAQGIGSPDARTGRPDRGDRQTPRAVCCYPKYRRFRRAWRRPAQSFRS